MLAVGYAAFADHGITEVTAVQRYPWNGKVDISYTASGVTAAASLRGMKSTLQVMAIDRLTVPWTTNVADRTCLLVGPSAANALDQGTALADGTHQIVWDMNAQGLTFASTNVIFVVACKVELGGVQLWENGPYWAECNVGATKPEEYGYCFWWGDTVGYKRNADNNGWISVKDGSSFQFVSENCPTYGKNNSQIEAAGYIDSTGKLVAAHDAATVRLGTPWRMPTEAELLALMSNCDTTWTTRGGVYGRLVTGRGAYASKSIFLPAAGRGDGAGLYGPGSDGYYWSSTPNSDDAKDAWSLYFNSSYFYRSKFYYRRWHGEPVRPLRGFAK